MRKEPVVTILTYCTILHMETLRKANKNLSDDSQFLVRIRIRYAHPPNSWLESEKSYRHLTSRNVHALSIYL